MTVAPEVRIEGSLVRLRPPSAADAPHFVRWYSDPEVMYWLHMSEGEPATEETERARIAAAMEDATQVLWIIETNQGRAIGNVGLLQIDPVHRRAWLGICIGEKDCWSAGYGADAIRLLLHYAFENLELRRVQLVTDVDNDRGIRCYEKCGFQREGLLRAFRLRLGQPINCYSMSILREEFEAQPWR